MSHSPRRFVLIALGLTAVVVGSLAILNFVVDPFNRYGNNRLGVYISAERECKSTYVRRYPHDALLLGNSREIRIPPAQLDGFRIFNAAFSGATAEEMYFFVQHFAVHERVVILAVDLGMADPPQRQGDIFAPKGLTSAFENLLNLQTTEYSMRTISESVSKKSLPIQLDGLVPAGSAAQEADLDDPQKAAYVLKLYQHIWDVYRCPPMEKMSFYVKISECLRQRGIPCVVMIPPAHADIARAAQSGQAVEQVAAWKRQVRTIFPHVIDLSFSSYNAATNFYRTDPLHFKPEIGVRFMNAEVLPFAAEVLKEAPTPAR
ncbi:MAG TPA: hypothetical protein VF988_15785 [Verrucomicrobiae bacterium]